ncbi:hypothetical protein GGQ68_004802 [Sagittula marina]|uniref:Uncharacterized protein n=1 Tax=Sagittula marina TaxID=943940 RepID=A0A7W6GUR3_9RHOB|nr:hypothetical protein [Sagittula marina]MBB3988445.1 hypothetical protein [Sagittula marina]
MSALSSRLEMIADVGFKVFSIVAICFGGLRYFQEREEIAQTDALSRSLSYIEEYGSERYVGARLDLHDFWVEHPQLVELLSSGGISERVYRAALSQDVFRSGAHRHIREPLILLDNLYSQVAFCFRSDLCEAKILTEFFCPIARTEAVAYAPFFERMTLETGDRDLGRDLSEFGSNCF